MVCVTYRPGEVPPTFPEALRKPWWEEASASACRMDGGGGGGSVSNVEVCNLAYAGHLEELKERLAANRSLVTRADQVGMVTGRWGIADGYSGLCFRRVHA